MKSRIIEPAEPGERTQPWKIILALIGALAVAIAIAWVMDRHVSSASAASPSSPPDATYDPTVVAKGAWLAAIGNCNTCHTASNGRAFAAGRLWAPQIRCLATSLAAPLHQTYHGLNPRRSYATERRAAMSILTLQHRSYGDLLRLLALSQ